MKANAQSVSGRGVLIFGEDAEKAVALLAANKAKHESAHAVVASFCGYGLSLVSITPEDAAVEGRGVWSGITTTVAPHVLPPPHVRAAWKLAGPLSDEACGIPLSITCVPCGGVGDFEAAREIAGFSTPGVPEIWSQGCMEAAFALARKILSEQAATVERLAAALEARGRLEGADLKAIFEDPAPASNVVSFTTEASR